ncbi:hypothetical protein HYH03_000495 [Edaphochlamys debaryana]|uniref:Uncharacterized protein n=1 Tax=Edaphochlamys debaryana TaxID=47281 RepID=A0A836C7G8_9CHLO|nr:hypothetical protein HYH03_000495 [Edaphochlamys debaryana]|eukprot:KAG2501999.1 hypothetical protein HYH03_000495 [Edaphochlamys debaryana]
MPGKARPSNVSKLRPAQRALLKLEGQFARLKDESASLEQVNVRLKQKLSVLEAIVPVHERQEVRLPSEPPRSPSVELSEPPLGQFCCPSPDPRSEPRGPGTGSACSSGGIHALAAARRASGSPGPSDDEVHSRWIRSWLKWAREGALLLAAYETRPSERYLKRMEEAHHALMADVVALNLHHRELISNMSNLNLDTGEEETPPDNFWQEVANGLRLSPEQVAACRTTLSLYRERMAAVLAERRTLAAQLDACMRALTQKEAGGPAAASGRRREQLTLEMEQVSAALADNVATEGQCVALARDLLGSPVFSCLQCVRGTVISYPYMPDALAIVTAAAAAQTATGDGSGA